MAGGNKIERGISDLLFLRVCLIYGMYICVHAAVPFTLRFCHLEPENGVPVARPWYDAVRSLHFVLAVSAPAPRALRPAPRALRAVW